MYKCSEVCGWHKCDKVPRGKKNRGLIVEIERWSAKQRGFREKGVEVEEGKNIVKWK